MAALYTQVVKLLYPHNDARLRQTLDALTRMERYLMRGGDFFHSMERESEVQDWCLQVRHHMFERCIYDCHARKNMRFWVLSGSLRY